jgi:glutamyl-tRNA synthetase
MKVVTRFAPSPTGDLHLGSSRTALFNYLFAKRYNGEFLLRIEDTDVERSSKASLENILDGLKWLGLNYDGEIVYQSLRTTRYLEIAEYLVTIGKAYYCYTPKEEIEKLRNLAKENKETFIFESPYRDNSIQPDSNENRVIRLKAPKEGKTLVNDVVQGVVEIDNSMIEDTILVRSDNTPTYMLSVVVDDIDMGITHIIRGVDHLTNSFRQILIYKALDASLPIFCHIPLIHGSDGSKMSKRHGATSLLEYKKLGYLPETMLNYLLRLGWSHGDDEMINKDDAISWFNLENIGKSPSRFDENKLSNLNFYYINKKTDIELLGIIKENLDSKLDDISFNSINKALKSIRERSRSIIELINIASFYIIGTDVNFDENSKNILKSTDKNLIVSLIEKLNLIESFNVDNIKEIAQDIASQYSVKLSSIMIPTRILMTGKEVSPSIFEMMDIVGKSETIKRLKQINVY